MHNPAADMHCSLLRLSLAPLHPPGAVRASRCNYTLLFTYARTRICAALGKALLIGPSESTRLPYTASCTRYRSCTKARRAGDRRPRQASSPASWPPWKTCRRFWRVSWEEGACCKRSSGRQAAVAGCNQVLPILLTTVAAALVLLAELRSLAYAPAFNCIRASWQELMPPRGKAQC